MNDQDRNIDFVDPPPYDCNCPICLETFKDKVCYQTKCCGHHICSECATRLKNMETPCAVCRSGSFDVTEDQFFTRQFLNLKVRCYYSNAGCKWTGELRQLDEHEKKCTRKLVECQYCNQNYHRGDINEHLLTCRKANAIVTCPNHCSNSKQKRDTIKAHLENECPLRVIIPPNGALSITANGETSIVPVSFTMLDYLKHLESEQPWYSPPFYTRESGYKLSIRVDVKLNKESNHLSVHTCVLKGEYDDQLQWPIHAEVRVSLLNWKGIPKSLYLPGDEYCKQVLVEEITPLGKGIVEFVSNEDLKLILNKNMQELSCKCLSFRVESVRILPMPQVIPDWAQHNSINYFVINSFKRMKKEERNEFFGPSFYTHKNGYKIELSVKFLPNGEIGTDVYVTARVVEREHGNKSVWPFYGELGIDLINWRNDKNHKHIKIAFHEYDQSDVVQSSVGILKLEEYSQLTYNSATNTEYLRNDCLFFKVALACTHHFTLDKFTTQKLSKNVYYSKPFFASGYKMQLCVKANVNGYIAVYVHLMKGPNDDKLIWPFCGDVVVELVSWIEDNDHHRRVIHLSPEVVTNNVCDRVLVGDRSISRGYPKFIQHSSIKPQFLQDDCLYFRVKEVVVYSTPLCVKKPPWLEEATNSFTITCFSDRIRLQEEYWSPPFYTSARGYRMCLNVYPAGNGTGKGTHVSMFGYLMKGDYDDELNWPFTADVVVDILNWRGDNNHHRVVLSFNEGSPDDACARVYDDNKVASGNGYAKAIEISTLMSSSSSDPQYLSEDCMCIRYDVVINSNQLLNKTPCWNQSSNSALEFTLNKFTLRSSYDNCYYSKLFFTSGYQMQICVKANVNGYIAVYVHLMKGPNDDKLIWPFCGDVVVELVNWIEDNDHHRRVIHLSPEVVTNNVCDRVLVGDRSISRGYPKFIQHSSIKPQFLQDDCLYFRVKEVVVYSTPLCVKKPPWLEEATNSFTITCFSDRIRLQEEYWSPPFYTSARGYRMCLNVYPAGNGTGKGTHVSMFGYLMKGDYDDELNWPFTADVVVDILNWRGDNNHHRVVLSFNEGSPDDACARVYDDNKVASGNGYAKAIEISTLMSSSSSDPQYLSEDCMCIRYDVVINSNQLLNKTPCWNQSSNSALEFTLNKFTLRSSYDNRYYSKLFFTSGYQMQICVKANVNGYIAVYVHLMKGPNDDKLIWPFCGDVVVELVNWIEDNDHHRRVIHLSPEVVTNNVCDRVLVGDRSISRGYPKFIQHSSIKPQFLQDDCLYFRVKEVVIHSNELSLKTPKWQNPQSLSPLIEFTVTNVSKRKEHNTTFYSPAFHNEGYKLRLEVQRSSDQQHIGIFARLLRGQHDDNLVWPFQASIVVELVNWREDANHHSYTIPFNERTLIKSKSQVTEGEKAPSGWGTDTFISYSSLDNTINREYLQDNCLRFRVKEIVVYSTPLCVKKPPWLEEAANSFTITCFSDRIRLQEEYWSPPFYTSTRGYRMCLKVYPAGAGEGTHVSMFGYLMKGDYDDELNWPFTADVVVDILNWRGDNNHNRVVLSFNEGSPDDACARVYDDNKVASGNGYAKAIEISTLMSSSSSDPQYLSEDCMCIRYDVVINSNQLLNKTPCWNQSSNSALEFTLNKFTLRSSYDNRYYSKLFFTSGYQMQICVKANVNGYIAVYVHLMKGPNDDKLIWPFCGDVVVELVNWIEDNDHHRRVIHLSPEVVTKNVCDRVLVGDRSISRGYPKFIQHSSIKPQFLQDDCLYFRVKEVVIHSNELSLKTPKWQNPQSLSPLIEFTVTNVSKRKEHNTTFYSPAFHNEGYKLRLEVQRSSDQQHIGIFARLLRGQHDDNLVWPFQASIVVELVNWREDANHHSYTIPFNERTLIKSKSQVTEGEKAPSGWGTDTFISYSSLDNTINREYLQDNCLRFRVKEIVVYSTPLCVKKPPWLEEAANSFTITCFSDRIRLQEEYWSPPFYTSTRGYRMCLKVYPAGAGEGTHVSMFGYLMKGDYDDELNWPFTADVVVDILNWRGDNNHHRVVLSFNEGSPDDACARVYDDNKVASGNGYAKAIEISTLMSSSSSDPQYLSEDCMCIRYDVVINSNQLLNKTPCWNQSSNSALEFTLNKFTLRSSYDNRYYSKLFFTSGYQMQICVKANVNGYIAVYVHLMKGPNDDKLIWPFCGDVVVELVNWIEDNDHHRRVIHLSPEVVTNNVCDRVLVGDRSISRGYPKFIQHSSIKPQFLQDDCLYFRVKEVVIHSNELSLKTPKWQNPQSLSPLIEFTVTNVSKRKEHNTTFYSPAFHNEGYKLRLEVQRSSDQQHIGIFARLLRGQHDDNLVWPFQASIVVELVNWREDANHHSYTIPFNERTPIECISQVTEGKRTPNGWGTRTFISYSSLDSTNTEYLQDDCLRFRVKEIVVYSTPLCVKKPLWLEEAANSFTITRFSDRIRLQEEYWSPPFYTSARGYRMCLNVCPAGNDTGKGTHVSMFGYLMKGDYDDELNWPFTADVVVDILNWRGDNNHHRVVCEFNEGSSDDARARVYDDNKVASGQGNAKAIEISTLMSSSSSDPQYLSEDCMCIRVHDVVIYNTQLLSKTPSWWYKPSVWQPEFTITGVSKHMKYNTPYISTPFYTHENGYKLRLAVCPNGSGSGAGTHVSIFFRLLKGEYDDNLKWPMNIKIQLTILNWCKDDTHITESYSISDTRVIGSNEEANDAWELHQFCTHSTLLTASEATKYVEDDCMRISLNITQK